MIIDALGTLNDFCSLKFLLLSTFLLPVFWLVFKFVEERLSPLQKIPSPPGALPLIGHVFEVLRRDNFLQALRSWTNQYAPMFVVHNGLGIGIGEPEEEIILQTIILLSLYVLFTQFDISREFAFWLFTNYAHGQVDVYKTWTPGPWTTPVDLQSRTKVLGTALQYIHIFLSFLSSLLKQCTLFKIFLQFSLFPAYTKLKLWKNSGYMHPTLFVGWGEGLGLCELENVPEMQMCPKTFVHDCSPWIPLWTWWGPQGVVRCCCN